MRDKDVIVVGGGIGGLVAALRLTQLGLTVRVLEQASEFGEVGAGLQIAPNCTRILDQLGLLEEVKSLGVLPDARGVYKRLTARENIAYFGELHGMSAAQVAERTRKLAGALQMEDVLDRECEGFSQGQRTKTAIARALVHDPRNVILDEPTNGLDVMTTRGLRGFLRQLRDEGRCVIFSSHIMQEVAALCDRIVVIAQGKVVAHGTPDEVREQTGEQNLEDAFVKAIGSEEGLHA